MALREHMLDYVINLLDVATDFSRASAKARHEDLLCCMEQGEIAGWDQTKKIDRVRRAHAQRHDVGQGSAQRVQELGAEYSPAFILIKLPACRSKLMRTRVSHTDTFVLMLE